MLDHSYTDADGNDRVSEDLNWELPTVPAANAPGRGTLETYGGTSAAAALWRPRPPVTPQCARQPTALDEHGRLHAAG